MCMILIAIGVAAYIVVIKLMDGTSRDQSKPGSKNQMQGMDNWE